MRVTSLHIADTGLAKRDGSYASYYSAGPAFVRAAGRLRA
jgi:hypothetical protein